MRRGFITEVRSIEAEVAAGLGAGVRLLGGLHEAIQRPTPSSADAVSQAGQTLRRETRGLDVRLVRLSATQAPVACDLRLTLTMMQLVQHHGLIANQFVLIGEQLDCIHPGVADRCGTGGPTAELAGLAGEQLRQAVQAFSERDRGLVDRLILSDDRLDRLNREICRLSLETRAGPEHRELAFRHVLIARSLERVGDNAVNIARHTAELVRADVHGLATPNDAPGLSVFR